MSIKPAFFCTSFVFVLAPASHRTHKDIFVPKVLEGAGASVTAASSAAEAMELLPKINPHVLVSDLGMPDEDGYDLIHKVRSGGRSARDLPAVALTAFAHKDYERRALLAGFQVHAAKPIDPYDLTAVIASLAGRTGGAHEG